MYAVIFRAQIKQLDEDYAALARRMRELALSEYGCTEFTSCLEGNAEIAISYWETKEQIQAWKNNPEHKEAQFLGRTRWYSSYRVQVVEVIHEYAAMT